MRFAGDPDDGLVRHCQAGDKRAFEELVEKYKEKVFNQCFFLLKQKRLDAEDAAQEIFTSVYRNLKSFDGRAKFSTWLHTVTRNHCLNMLKQRDSKHESLEAAHPAPAGNPAHESSATEDCVRQKLDLLSEAHRMVIALVHFDGLSYEEAAELLECPVGTVRSRLNRALQELKPLVRECL